MSIPFDILPVDIQPQIPNVPSKLAPLDLTSPVPSTRPNLVPVPTSSDAISSSQSSAFLSSSQILPALSTSVLSFGHTSSLSLTVHDLDTNRQHFASTVATLTSSYKPRISAPDAVIPPTKIASAISAAGTTIVKHITNTNTNQAVVSVSTLSPNMQGTHSSVTMYTSDSTMSSSAYSVAPAPSQAPSFNPSSQLIAVRKLVFGILGAIIIVASLATLFGWLYKRMIMQRPANQEFSLATFLKRICGFFRGSCRHKPVLSPLLPSFSQAGSGSAAPYFFKPPHQEHHFTDISQAATVSTAHISSQALSTPSMERHADEVSSRRVSCQLSMLHGVTPDTTTQQSTMSRNSIRSGSYQYLPSERNPSFIPAFSDPKLVSRNTSFAQDAPRKPQECQVPSQSVSPYQFSVPHHISRRRSSIPSNLSLAPLTTINKCRSYPAKLSPTEYPSPPVSSEVDEMLSCPTSDSSWTPSMREQLYNSVTGFGAHLQQTNNSTTNVRSLYPLRVVNRTEKDVIDDSPRMVRYEEKEFGVPVLRKGRVPAPNQK